MGEKEVIIWDKMALTQGRLVAEDRFETWYCWYSNWPHLNVGFHYCFNIVPINEFNLLIMKNIYLYAHKLEYTYKRIMLSELAKSVILLKILRINS